MQWHDRPLLSSEWSGVRGRIGLKVVVEPGSNNTASSELSSRRGKARVRLRDQRETLPTDRPQSRAECNFTFLGALPWSLAYREKNASINLPGAHDVPGPKSNSLWL